MRTVSKIIDIILFVIVGVLLFASITSAIWKKPMLLTSVRSNSMYPLFERSDLLLIKSIVKENEINIGDIIVFKAEEGSLSTKGWVVHRIVGGNEEQGFITKGDANDYTDQNTAGGVPIQRGWIGSKVLTIGGSPLKIPLLGYLPLWMESFQATKYSTPIIALLLAAIVGVSEYVSSKKGKRKKNKGLDLPLIYFIGGLAVSVVVSATMITSSQRIKFPFEVTNDQNGVSTGSSVGILKLGDEINKTIANLDNKGFFPFITTITSKNNQILFNEELLTLKPGNSFEIKMNLKASELGAFEPIIYIGMFYPFLPKQLIFFIVNHNYWLGVILISIIPGLPFMLYPIFDRKLRNKIKKEIRRLNRRIRRKLLIFNLHV